MPGSPGGGGERRRSAAALLVWVAIPAAVALLYGALPAVTEMRSQYQASAVALLTAPALGLLLVRRGPLAHHAAAALTACFLPALTLVALNGTHWFFSGPYGDQSFRMEYAARFADDLGSLSDYVYRGVPAFYSPGWFWIVGASSRVTGVPAWQAYKWVAVASLFVAAVLAFWLWRRSCGTRLSALLLAVTVLGLPATTAGWLGGVTLLGAGASEPYGWLVALPLPALLTWFGSAAGPFSWRRGVALGVAVAAAAWLYLLYALVAVVAVVVLVLWRGGRWRWWEAVLGGGTSAVLLLPWLGRYLREWIAAGRPSSMAMTWVDDDSYVRLLSPSASPWFLVAALGGVALLGLSGREHRRLRGCQALLAAVLGLSLVQLLAGQAGGGVLAHRLLILLGTALLAGAVLAGAALAPRLAPWRTRWAGATAWRRVGAAALTVAFFIGATAHATEWMSMDSDLRKIALGTPYPDGSKPALAESQEPARPSIEQIAAAARQVAGQAGRGREAVVLTDDMALLAETPLYGYLPSWALYSNPLGDYAGRRAFLERLVEQPPDGIVRTLREEPEGPTVFVLRMDGDAVRFSSSDWDPRAGESEPWSVDLDVALFEREDFVTTQVGDRLVSALRTG